MSVGFFVYILVFSKKHSAKPNAACKMAQRKSTPVLNEPTCFFSYAGSGGRTIKIDVLSSKTHHKLTKERRNNAALLAYAQFVF